MDQPPQNLTKCNLIGAFGTVVQLFLILLVVLAVKIKHAFESPKRRMILFLLDGTKQLLSSGMLHVANVVFSVIIGGGSTGADQCGVYIMAFIIDVSLGIVICYYFLKLLDKFLTYKNSKKLKSGNYFRREVGINGQIDVYIDYVVWAEQTAIWCLIVLIMKIIVTVIQYSFSEVVVFLGNGMMSIFGGHDKLKLFTVVIIIPITFNTIQFVIQDTFLKKSDFEITDVEIMKKYYDCTNEVEQLEGQKGSGEDVNGSIELRPTDPTQLSQSAQI